MTTNKILKIVNSICNGWTYEYKYDSLRKFKFDYANLRLKIAIEMEGGIYTGTGHAKIGRYLKDMEKYNMASIKGWIILRYGHGQEKNILKDVKMAIERRRLDIAFKDDIKKIKMAEVML